MSSTFSPFLAQLLMDGLARRARLSTEARGNPAPLHNGLDRPLIWGASLGSDYATALAAHREPWDMALAWFLSGEGSGAGRALIAHGGGGDRR